MKSKVVKIVAIAIGAVIIWFFGYMCFTVGQV